MGIAEERGACNSTRQSIVDITEDCYRRCPWTSLGMDSCGVCVCSVLIVMGGESLVCCVYICSEGQAEEAERGDTSTIIV